MSQAPPPDSSGDSASPVSRPASPVSGAPAGEQGAPASNAASTPRPDVPAPGASTLAARPVPAPVATPASPPAPAAIDRARAESLDMAAAGLAEPIIPGPPWLAPRITRRQIDAQWVFVAGAMLLAGTVFFGWRGAAQAGVAIGFALLTSFLIATIIRLTRRREPVDPPLYTLGAAMLLGACLPAGESLTLSIIAGGMLGVLVHLVGRSHRVRIHPVAGAILLAWILPIVSTSREARITELLVQPHTSRPVLRPERVVVGDLHDFGSEPLSHPWWVLEQEKRHDAQLRHEPAGLLVDESRKVLLNDWFLGRMLASGELCRLEEVLLGAVPGRIGATSRALLMMLGLFLMYRRLLYWPMIAAAIAGALAAMLALPIPGEPGLTLMGGKLVQLPILVVVTYIAYMLLGSPLLLLTLILAPSTAPTSHAGRVVYGALLGAVLMMTQWFSAAHAEFLALALVGVLSRPLDGLQKQGLART